MYIGPAVWGILTSIGLFRLKNWARISVIVFSVLLILMSAFSGLGLLVLPVISVPKGMPDPGVMLAVRVLMGVFWAVLLGIGIWWLVFFNRAKVKQQFAPLLASMPAPPVQAPYLNQAGSGSTVTVPQASGCPVSLTVIAWILIVSCAFVPLNLVMRTPAVFLTKLVVGWPAAIYYVVVAALLLYIGIGLLRLKPAARLVGIGYFAFTFVNSAIFFLAPGSGARMQSLIEWQEKMFPWGQLWQSQAALISDLRPMFVVDGCFGLALADVPVYFLFTRKQAFERAASVHQGGIAV